MNDRIVIGHGAPFLGLRSPLDTFVIPALEPLGIEITTFERADLIDFRSLADIKRAYFITHSHASEWTEMMLGRTATWWPKENRIGWTSIDGVRFTDDESSDVVDPQYAPQTHNLPFIVPSVVNICRAYHRHLPWDRNTTGLFKPLADIANFPTNSLFQAGTEGQDVEDREVAGTVSGVLASLGTAVGTSLYGAIGGAVGSLVGGCLGSQIDHNLIVAACTPTVVESVKQFFGLSR